MDCTTKERFGGHETLPGQGLQSSGKGLSQHQVAPKRPCFEGRFCSGFGNLENSHQAWPVGRERVRVLAKRTGQWEWAPACGCDSLWHGASRSLAYRSCGKAAPHRVVRIHVCKSQQRSLPGKTTQWNPLRNRYRSHMFQSHSQVGFSSSWPLPTTAKCIFGLSGVTSVHSCTQHCCSCRDWWQLGDLASAPDLPNHKLSGPAPRPSSRSCAHLARPREQGHQRRMSFQWGVRSPSLVRAGTRLPKMYRCGLSNLVSTPELLRDGPTG